MSEIIKCKVTADTPTTTTPSVTLFDSQTIGESWLRNAGISRLALNLINTASCTVTLSGALANGSYYAYDTQAIAASSAAWQVYDWDVMPYSNVKLAVVSHSATEQTVWGAEITLATDRNPGT